MCSTVIGATCIAIPLHFPQFRSAPIDIISSMTSFRILNFIAGFATRPILVSYPLLAFRKQLLWSVQGPFSDSGSQHSITKTVGSQTHSMLLEHHVIRLWAVIVGWWVLVCMATLHTWCRRRAIPLLQEQTKLRSRGIVHQDKIQRVCPRMLWISRPFAVRASGFL